MIGRSLLIVAIAFVAGWTLHKLRSVPAHKKAPIHSSSGSAEKGEPSSATHSETENMPGAFSLTQAVAKKVPGAFSSDVAERLLNGSVGQILEAVELLPQVNDIPESTRREIAERICRFQAQGNDVVFELIRARLREQEKEQIDLSFCST